MEEISLQHDELEDAKRKARERKKYHQKRIRMEERIIKQIEEKQQELNRRNQPKLFEEG